MVVLARADVADAGLVQCLEGLEKTFPPPIQHKVVARPNTSNRADFSTPTLRGMHAVVDALVLQTVGPRDGCLEVGDAQIRFACRKDGQKIAPNVSG